VTLLRHVGVLLLGAVVALAAVIVHRWSFPLGLALAVTASVATPARLAASRHPRTSATYVGGWLLVLAVVIAGRPEGDYAIAADGEGYALMATGLVLVVVALVGLTRSGDREP
jgi:Family of unknown function (DUF6113)